MFMNRRRKSISLGIGAEYTFKDTMELERIDFFWKTGFLNLLIRLFPGGGK